MKKDKTKILRKRECSIFVPANICNEGNGILSRGRKNFVLSRGIASWLGFIFYYIISGQGI